MKEVEVRGTIQGFYATLSKRFLELSPEQKLLAGTLALVAVVAIAYLIMLLMYVGKVYPKVYVSGIEMSGLTKEQVEEKLAVALQNNKKPITISYQDKTSTINPEEIDWQLDVKRTAADVFAVGRSESGWRSFAEQINSLFFERALNPVVSYDQDQLANKLAAIVGPINNPAVNASAEFSKGKLVISKGKAGTKVDEKKIKQTILEHWRDFAPADISMELVEDLPELIIGDEGVLNTQVSALLSINLTLQWPNSGTHKLTQSDLQQLIDFHGGDSSEESPDQKILTAGFTEGRTTAFLDVYSRDNINQPAKEPKLVIENGALTIASSSAPGLVVDLKPSAESVMNALSSSDQNKTAVLTLKSQDPVINENSLASLGIKELIGEGTTNFVGSPTNRVANIKNGVTLLQSALIKPGEEFSTIKNLGVIDNTTGFLPELVIKENRTVPEFGGGLCQVSTTLFRAVMDAGLKVTARKNHSYRVSYYEPPVGLDATIYDPAPDFKFLNDTNNYILIQGWVEGTKVHFNLWGTSDGRSSAISDPIILKTVPSGEPIYTNTDTLNIGETKQIEKPHDGATTTATYTVTRNGQVINEQVFRSVYKPWPAQFLVGTHDPNAPAS
jgi:vancomycin resistance protein YoaR